MKIIYWCQRRASRLVRDDKKQQQLQCRLVTTKVCGTPSDRTTHPTLKQMGCRSGRPYLVPLLSAKKRKLRLRFKPAHQNQTITGKWLELLQHYTRSQYEIGRRKKCCFEESQFTGLKQLPQSWDLNPIKLLWAMVDSHNMDVATVWLIMSIWTKIYRMFSVQRIQRVKKAKFGPTLDYNGAPQKGASECLSNDSLICVFDPVRYTQIRSKPNWTIFHLIPNIWILWKTRLKIKSNLFLARHFNLLRILQASRIFFHLFFIIYFYLIIMFLF